MAGSDLFGSCPLRLILSQNLLKVNCQNIKYLNDDAPTCSVGHRVSWPQLVGDGTGCLGGGHFTSSRHQARDDLLFLGIT